MKLFAKSSILDISLGYECASVFYNHINSSVNFWKNKEDHWVLCQILQQNFAVASYQKPLINSTNVFKTRPNIYDGALFAKVIPS